MWPLVILVSQATCSVLATIRDPQDEMGSMGMPPLENFSLMPTSSTNLYFEVLAKAEDQCKSKF